MDGTGVIGQPTCGPRVVGPPLLPKFYHKAVASAARLSGGRFLTKFGVQATLLLLAMQLRRVAAARRVGGKGRRIQAALLKDPDKTPQAAATDIVSRLEAVLAFNEGQVRCLEEQAEALSAQSAPDSPLHVRARERQLRDLQDRCLTLSSSLADLAADALEHACSGLLDAMDVFEHANLALDRLARCIGCLRLCQVAGDGT
mmetsp:Transcript_1737/g.5094  ORF Transcript_1737/g.5094 Transcript_1737/m.5094 type:complete len:201 (+) Transcript_1737:70-672(+)